MEMTIPPFPRFVSYGNCTPRKVRVPHTNGRRDAPRDALTRLARTGRFQGIGRLRAHTGLHDIARHSREYALGLFRSRCISRHHASSPVQQSAPLESLAARSDRDTQSELAADPDKFGSDGD